MADFLSTGISGLFASQAALATTSHNISNVNTPGYSRQRAVVATRIPQPTSAGFIGTGVNVTDVERMYDRFATQQIRTHTSQDARLSAYYDLASQVDNLLADPEAGLAPSLQSFFDASQALADNPSSVPARQVYISEANSLVERFGTIDRRMTALRDSINVRLQNLTSQINTLSTSIAKVNYDIVISTSKADGQAPNDLLDQRDELLRQLAELVPVTTTDQGDGAVNVFVGNGQTLVLGHNARGLGTTSNPYNPYLLEVTVGTDGSGAIISDFLAGGELGGVLEFRDEILETTQNALGRVAFGLADAMNSQHAMGLDLNNSLGKQFFGLTGLDTPKLALKAASNISTATVAFTVTDTSVLTASDYRLAYDGTNYNLTRLTDGQNVGNFAPGPYPFTYNVASEGLTLTIDSAPAANDSFLLEPTRSAAADIKMLISDVKDIATAAPLRSEQPKTNLGSGKITNPEATAATNLPLILAAVDPVRLEFDLNAGGAGIPGFLVTGGTAGAGLPLGAGVLLYDPATQSNGVSFDLGTLDANYAGATFTVSGVPLDADVYTIGKNNNATGDNRNALKLAGLQEAPLLENGTTNLQTAYGQVVSGVGARTHQLDINSQAQKTILTQAVQTREEIAGVNLDEEAASLIRFQQAYQASAQVIAAADTLFQTLIDAVRR